MSGMGQGHGWVVGRGRLSALAVAGALAIPALTGCGIGVTTTSPTTSSRTSTLTASSTASGTAETATPTDSRTGLSPSGTESTSPLATGSASASGSSTPTDTASASPPTSTSVATTPPILMPVRVFLSTGSGSDCGQVTGFQRQTTQSNAVLKAALNELLMGPTAQEKAAGASSWFSESTKDALIGVNVVNGTAYVNLRDFSTTIPNASTSCGSQALLAQLTTTAKSAGEVSRVLYAFDGQPRAFYEWLQMSCDSSNDNCDPAHFRTR